MRTGHSTGATAPGVTRHPPPGGCAAAGTRQSRRSHPPSARASRLRPLRRRSAHPDPVGPAPHRTIATAQTQAPERRSARCPHGTILDRPDPDSVTLAYAGAKQASRRPQPGLLNVIQTGRLATGQQTFANRTTRNAAPLCARVGWLILPESVLPEDARGLRWGRRSRQVFRSPPSSTRERTAARSAGTLVLQFARD